MCLFLDSGFGPGSGTDSGREPGSSPRCLLLLGLASVVPLIAVPDSRILSLALPERVMTLRTPVASFFLGQPAEQPHITPCAACFSATSQRSSIVMP